jgi:DNA-binding transcriptional MocR family regulator
VTLGTSELLALLGDWAITESSLYIALSDALIASVLSGDLAVGTRLPAERNLARGIGVSRGTVMAAYDRLRQIGYAESRGGSGTSIRRDIHRPLVHADIRLGDASRYRGLSARLLNPAQDVVDLALALPRDANDLPSDFFDVPGEIVRAVAGETGMAPQGGMALRVAIANRYSNFGLPTHHDQIVVTGGGQQGIDLCASLLIRPGDTVLAEEATYPGALSAFVRHGAKIRTIPVQGYGGDLRSLQEAVSTYHPRLVYLMPSMHNPTGISTNNAWRRQLAAFSDKSDLYLVEDDSLADLNFDKQQLFPVATYSRNGKVFTIGSLSKSVWGGLRIGWIRSNTSAAEQFGQLKAAKDLGLSAFGQAAAVHIFPRLDEIIAARTSALATRAEVMLDLLQQHLPQWKVVLPDGGLTIWTQLPLPIAEEVSQRATRFGVAVSPGSTHCAGTEKTDRIRLSFAQEPEVLAEGVKRLARAWEASTDAVRLLTQPSTLERSLTS